MSELPLDAAGRRHPPGCRSSCRPIAGQHGPALPGSLPPRMRSWPLCAVRGDGAHGRRLRGLIIVLWRAGLRICEALALAEADLDRRRGSLLVLRGKGAGRREVGMDDWAWEQLEPWLQARVKLPRAAVLRRHRPDARAAVGGRRRLLGAAPASPGRDREPPLALRHPARIRSGAAGRSPVDGHDSMARMADIKQLVRRGVLQEPVGIPRQSVRAARGLPTIRR
jgi:integrase